MTASNPPKSSPWGKIQDATKIAKDCYRVSTASHGGLKLSRSFNAQMPECVRRNGGWYEEDQEWALVALVFPSMFPEREQLVACTTVRDYYPDEYYQITGKAADPTK